jgi:glycosyltransferase involved in cell wall biosynthesis
MTLHVALVTHFFPGHRGGVEAVAGEIASRLARAGVAQITWHASDTDPPPADAPGLRCVPAANWNVVERALGFPYPLWGPAALARLARAARAADVVHLHECQYLPSLVAWAAAAAARRPVVITQHVGRIPFRNPLWRAILAAVNHVLGRLLLGSAAQAIFVSAAVMHHFARFVRFRQPALVVPNGVDTRTFRPADERARRALRVELAGDAETPLLLFVGRFVEKKGLAILQRLAEELPRARWIFAGWGPLDPGRWGLPNVAVQRELAKEQLVPLYQAADLLVLPSAGEGFPLVVQEAMACGTPALVGEETAAGCPEAADVLLCEPLAPARWSARITALLASPANLRSLRARVAEFAHATWSWERCAHAYGEILSRCAARR